MSAWDIAGSIVWTFLAAIYFCASLTPSDPPHPRYGTREAQCFLWAVVFAAASAFCIARLCGAHA